MNPKVVTGAFAVKLAFQAVMDLSLPQLRAFVAIVDAGSITAAAERVFLSQPALSKQLQRLELTVGAELVTRSRNGVALTEAGEALLPHVRAALAAWDQGARDVAAVQGRSATMVRIGLRSSLGRGLLRRAIGSFTTRWPGWTVQIRQSRWDQPLAGLLSDTADVAVLWSPRPDDERLNVLAVGTEAVSVLVPDDHHLADRPHILAADLAGAAMIAMPRSVPKTRSYWLGDGRIPGIEVAAEAATPDEYYEAVSSGLGLALVSARHGRQYERGDGVRTVEVADLPASELFVVWRRNDDRAAVVDLVDLLAKAAKERA